MIWWFISARKWFKGPKVNLDHLMLGREDQAIEIAKEEGQVLEGKSDDQSSGSEDHFDGLQVGDKKPHGL